jgi:hypothetical protein
MLDLLARYVPHNNTGAFIRTAVECHRQAGLNRIANLVCPILGTDPSDEVNQAQKAQCLSWGEKVAPGSHAIQNNIEEAAKMIELPVW